MQSFSRQRRNERKGAATDKKDDTDEKPSVFHLRGPERSAKPARPTNTEPRFLALCPVPSPRDGTAAGSVPCRHPAWV